MKILSADTVRRDILQGGDVQQKKVTLGKTSVADVYSFDDRFLFAGKMTLWRSLCWEFFDFNVFVLDVKKLVVLASVSKV
mgnify:CR=1 FL=1